MVSTMRLFAFWRPENRKRDFSCDRQYTVFLYSILPDLLLLSTVVLFFFAAVFWPGRLPSHLTARLFLWCFPFFALTALAANIAACLPMRFGSK